MEREREKKRPEKCCDFCRKHNDRIIKVVEKGKVFYLDIPCFNYLLDMEYLFND